MKKIFLIFNLTLISFFFGFFVLAQTATTSAQTEVKNSSPITFTPNVDIPGFFEGEQKIDSNSVAKYINAVYRYGAGFAGVIAIFMIVFAAWQWIMAAGNSGKIENAKDTIISALIGLALLFGGYLLLSQISSRLVELKPLSVSYIGSKYLSGSMCSELLRKNVFGEASEKCGSSYTTTTSAYSVKCIDNVCSEGYKCYQYDQYDERIGDCPPVVDLNENIDCSCARLTACAELTTDNCGQYIRFSDAEGCMINRCFGQIIANGQTFNNVCGLFNDTCVSAADSNIPHTNCSANSECILDTNGDGVSEYCCDNEGNDWVPDTDECELITWIDSQRAGGDLTHQCY